MEGRVEIERGSRRREGKSFRLLYEEGGARGEERTLYFNSFQGAQAIAPRIADANKCCSLEYWDLLDQDWRCEEIYSRQEGEEKER